MPTVAEALDLAVKQHQSGNVQEAESLYRQVLQADPKNHVALHLLGVVAFQAGKGEQACHYILESLRIHPDYAEGFSNLGLVFMHLGRLEDAVTSLKQAVRLNPRYAEAHNNLGLALQRVGKLGDAKNHWKKAIRINPECAEAHHNLGAALQQQGRLKDAVTSLKDALRVRPNYPEAYNTLGLALRMQGKLGEAVAAWETAVQQKPAFPEAHNNLGLARREQGRLDDAIISLREAVRLKPDYADGQSNLGAALKEQGLLTEAADSLLQSIRLNPNSADAYSNLSLVLLEQGRPDEAIVRLQEALRINPQFAEAHNNMGMAQREFGRLEAAIASFERALQIQPDNADAHQNLGMTLLLAGDLQRGWVEYEWRRKCRDFSIPRFKEPQWDGAPLKGRTILLHAEQGLGDTLQFIRYAPLVKALGGRTIVACQPALLRLLARAPGIDELVAIGSLPRFDVYAPLPSLPGLLKSTLETIPCRIPTLASDPVLDERWRVEFSSNPAFKIGIAWQGNRRHRADRFRSVPLTHFAPLAQQKGVQLFSLQKGDGSDQLSRLAGEFAVSDLASRLDEETGPFMDTASVMKSLDLIITSDTSIAHLAGSLGVPVWVALPLVPDWRWLLKREDSPWYPTMRLFRQTERGNWKELFGRMAKELPSLVERRDRDAASTPPAQKQAVAEKPAAAPGASAPAIGAATSREAPVITYGATQPAPAAAQPTPAAPALAATAETAPAAVASKSPASPAASKSQPPLAAPPAAQKSPPPAPAAVAPRSQVAHETARPIEVEISPGELLDKIAILEIKAERVTDAVKLAHVRGELDALRLARDQAIQPSDALQVLVRELKAINETLWQVEDNIRLCERAGDFGPRFIDLARSVYQQNDRRAGVKRRINEHLGSLLMEEKEYAS